MATNQNQGFGQNSYGWQRTTPETCLQGYRNFEIQIGPLD